VPDDARLSEFDKHKKSLLDILRNACERRPNSKPFDGDKAWARLIGLAQFYYGRGRVKQETMPAADRIERLRDIAKALGRARRLVARAMRNDAGGALYSSWCEANPYFRHDPDGREQPLTPIHIKVFDQVRTKNEFDKVFAGLATLEKAASRAADDVPPSKRGRPPILSRDDIWNLAALYRDSTGSIPGAGDGPFAKFVVEVLTAAGRADDIEYGSIIEAIKGARQWALMHPVARKWGPSPFDEET
jgi:hypothetical protein